LSIRALARQRSRSASAGFYTSPWDAHARLQILTVAELLEGKRINAPPLGQLSQTSRKAAQATEPQPQLPLRG